MLLESKILKFNSTLTKEMILYYINVNRFLYHCYDIYVYNLTLQAPGQHYFDYYLYPLVLLQ